MFAMGSKLRTARLNALRDSGFGNVVTALQEFSPSFREHDIYQIKYTFASSLGNLNPTTLFPTMFHPMNFHANVIIHTELYVYKFRLNPLGVKPAIPKVYQEDLPLEIKGRHMFLPVETEEDPTVAKGGLSMAWTQAAMPVLPSSRRERGKVSFDNTKQMFTCSCLNQYCLHLRDYFISHKDRTLLNGLAFNQNKVILLPIGEGYAYASVTANAYPATVINPAAHGSEVVFNVQDVLGHEILLQDDQSLIDVIRFLDDLYLVAPEALKVRRALANNTDFPCAGKRHKTLGGPAFATIRARKDKDLTANQIIIGESYHLTIQNKCMTCSRTEVVNYNDDIPDF